MSLFGDFDSFWAAYPRKVGRGAAVKAYGKALRIAPHDAIMVGLSQQIPAMQAKETKFIPHASTWLNQERWTDEPEDPTASGNGDNTGGNAADKQISFASAAIRTPGKDCF